MKKKECKEAALRVISRHYAACHFDANHMPNPEEAFRKVRMVNRYYFVFMLAVLALVGMFATLWSGAVLLGLIAYFLYLSRHTECISKNDVRMARAWKKPRRLALHTGLAAYVADTLYVDEGCDLQGLVKNSMLDSLSFRPVLENGLLNLQKRAQQAENERWEGEIDRLAQELNLTRVLIVPEHCSLGASVA